MVSKSLLALSLVFALFTPIFGKWTSWQRIPNSEGIGEPSVVYTQNGTIHVLVRGTDNALRWTRSTDGGKTWYGNQPLWKWAKVGGVLTSAPSCIEPLPNVVDCYVRNSSKGVSQIYLDSNGWSKWIDQSGVLLTNVSATTVNQYQRHLFGVGADGKLFSKLFDGFPKPMWLSWKSEDDELGKNAWVACSETGRNSITSGEYQVTLFDTVCVFNSPGGQFSAVAQIKGNRKLLKNIADVRSDFPAFVELQSLSTGFVMYFVDKDKQMKRGVYKFNGGWTGPFETIGNGQFASGPSCSSRIVKNTFNAVCTARGTDGGVWYSLRYPG